MNLEKEHMNKLVDLIASIEEKISALIVLCFGILCFPFVKMSQKILPVFSFIKEFISNTLRAIIQGILSFIQILNSMIGPRAWNYYRHKIKNFIEDVRKEKASRIKLSENKKDTKDITNGVANTEPRAVKRSFADDFGNLVDAFVDRLSKISPVRFALMGLLFLIILLNSFHFLSSSNDLVITIEEDQSTQARRSLASTIEDIPAYYNDTARISDIKGLKIPAYASSISKIRNLELDAYILFYNRKAKQFFDENAIIFIDHLELSLEPVLPSFPLSPEGKMILKEKIKYEITLLLHDMGIDSHVENVFFTNIFAN